MAMFTSSIIRNPLPENLCPVCGEKPVTTCRCWRSHSVCKNGHKWHTEGYSVRELREDGRLHVVETGYKLTLD